MNVVRIALLAACLAPLGPSPGLADEPVLELESRSGSVAAADATTTVAVWSDGTVHVHRPAYLKAAGDYRTVLGDAELAALMAHVAEQQLTDITNDGIEAAKRRAAAGRAQRAAAGQPQIQRVVTDPDIVTITVRMPGSPLRSSGAHVIRYAGVPTDAASFPEVDELARLDAAAGALAALAERRDLERLP